MKTFSVILFLLLAFSCKQREVITYQYKYNGDVFDGYVWVEIVEKALLNKSQLKNLNYATLYICRKREDSSCIKIISLCNNYNFKKGSFVMIFKCDNSLRENEIINVASTPEIETTYQNARVYFGMPSIPAE